MSLRTRLVLCLLLYGNTNLNGSQLISGNATTSTETTSFKIGTHAFDIMGGSLGNPSMFIGAGETVASNEYAIARANPTTNSLDALAPANINLNNTDGVANPLNGAKINFLSLNHDNPSIIKDGDKKVYAYHTSTSKLISSDEEVKDTTGATTDSILALEVANGNGQTFVASTSNTSGSTFGQSGSGIALFDKKVNDGITTLILQNNKKACALDNSSASVKINSDVSLENAVDMFWDGDLQCLFIGLQATSGSTAGDGARSVVVGKIQQVSGKSYNEIVFEKFAPDALFSGNNQIIGNATASSAVSAIKLKTMITSTKLHYLIVNGGNGAANTVGNQVYALPIVNGANSNKGHLAQFDQTPTDTFNDDNLFTGRTLNNAATTTSDGLTSSSTAAKVGGGNLPLNANETISDLFVAGDCVYASIGTTSASNATGVFYSQAIFDDKGLIANWTPWQRAGGSKTATFGAALNQKDGSFWFLNGTSASAVKTIKKTIWGTGSKDGLFGGTTTDETAGLVANLSALFPDSSGGLFSINNISKENDALNNISLLVATGSEKVAIIDPNATTTGDFSTGLISSTNDTMPAATSSSTIASITGTNLSSLGPIVTSHIASTGSESWLVVGGANGAAILRQTSGAGWSVALTGLSGISTSFKFETLGNYSYVKKITSDSNYLYILDENQLDRIALTSTAISASTATTIAQVGTLSGTTSEDVFNDFIVSGNLGVLATSVGAYRVSNGGDIGGTTVGWTKLSIPENRTVPCSKLISISPNNGLANGGNLYVLSSYRGLHQAQINRFYVNLSTTIDDNTIKPLPDIFLKDSNSYFINFESFKDSFFTDGSLLMNSLSKDGDQNSYAHLMQPGITSGTTNTSLKSPYNIPLTEISDANFVSSIVRSSDAGSMIIGGEFGILVNE